MFRGSIVSKYEPKDTPHNSSGTCSRDGSFCSENKVSNTHLLLDPQAPARTKHVKDRWPSS